VPAQAIIDQFELAKSQSVDPAQLRAWLPMLAQYGPDLLVTCANATELAKKLVAEWLNSYMFRGENESNEKSQAIANWLADHRHFMTHGRPISRQTAEERGLKITQLEADSELQDAVLSVHHATAHTFGMTGAVKIVENQLGKAFLQVVQQTFIGPPVAPVVPTP
jgi:hypothetical protein